MSLLEFCTESKKKQKTNQVSRSQRVDHESITSRLRANHEPTTRDKGTYRSLFDLVSLSSRSRAVAMLFAVLTLSIANIGMAWGEDFSANEISTSGTTKNHVTCKSTAGSSSGNSCTEKGGKYSSSVTVSKITSDGMSNYIEISAAEGYELVSPVEVTGVVDNNSNKNILVVYWEGNYDNTNGASKYDEISWPNRKTACASTTVSLSWTGTIRTIRLYRKAYFHTTSKLLGTSSTGGYTQLGGGTNLNVTNITATASATGGGSCSAPTSPSITGTTEYTAGQEISLTASATGAESATYTWYKGADWATASAGSSVGSGATFTKASCVTDDAGTYWCNISNGTGCEVQVSKTITVAEASCDAADLTASNITSNGDQDAGTGITFAKVGSPASGDTWYWQTSATGTDKTYNASSPYTTANTVGSYTVYLRAYNTAADCWGTAASMTNTIYPAPSAMIHNTFAVNDAWGSTIATQDKTNITSLNAMAAVGESVGSGSNKSGLTQKIPSQSSEDASKYMSLSFNVASGKQLNVTSVVFDEQPVTSTGTFKVSISDNQGSATKTQTIASGAAGSKHTLTLNGDIVGSFQGTVTVKVWAYGWSGGYRFGDYFYINGTVTATAPCSTPADPDGFAAGSITATGATFTITDDESPASYDIYYSTINSAPDAGTAATTTSTSKTKAVTGLTANTTYYAWVRSVCDADHKSAWVAASSFTTLAPPATYDVTFTLTNVVYSSGDNQGTDAATEGVAFSTVFAASSGYVLPSTITVTIGGSPATVGTGYTWNASTGAFQVLADQVTGDIVVTIAGETAPAGDCGEIIRSTFSGTKNSAVSTTTFNTTGTIGGTSTSYQIGDAGKLNTEGAYLILKLSTGTFLKGDTIKISSDKSGGVKFATGTVSTQTYTLIGTASTATSGGQPYYFVLAANADSIIVPRGASSSDYNQNPKITYVSVCRPCPECDATPAEPTAFTAGSIKSTGATFTITDAANAASYDIYYSTSNSAPDAGTAATTTSTEKTKAVTGLTANTTYYAWVRAVCDESHKSGWVAADPFATPAAVTYDVIYHDHRSVSGSPAPETEKTGSVPATVGYLEDAEVTVAGNTGSLTFSIEGATATFRGWSTSSTGFGGTFYAAGANFNMPASDVDLYAVWSYPIEYNENGGTINDASYPSYYIYIDNESGSETVTATLPTNVTKTGYEFGGWFDNSGCTGSAITTITGNYYGTYVLYAKWTKASDCVTITNFETSKHNKSNNKPDSQSYYLYGYKTTVDSAHAVTLTTTSTNNYGQNSGVEIRVDNNSTLRIYANNATKETPASFTDVVSVSFKAKLYNSGSTERTTGYTIKVGGTTVGSGNIVGKAADGYFDITTGTFAAKNGYIDIILGSGNSNNNLYIEDISICQADDCEDSEVSIAAVNSSVCAGSKIKITSSGYADGADFQWQKLNGSTWTDIDGATLDSLVIASAAVGNAGSFRLIAHKTCNRTSNVVTIAVPSAPVFGAVTSPRSVMATQALSITDVEASDATSYAWYKSADATFDAGDTQIGTTKNLMKTYADEAIASPSYYLFCVATNSCGADTTSAIAVNVTEIVDEECATRGNEGEAAFGFNDGGCSSTTYSETACWQSGGRAYYLTYSAPTGKYLKVAKVTVASSKDSKCGYAYSTDNGTNWTYAELTGLSTTFTEKTINLSAYGNVTDFRIGRNLQDGSSKDWGSTTGALYLSRACFEYSKACTATTVTPGISSEDHTIGNSFTEPTFTVKHGNTAFDPQPTITYTSSNEDVATVDDDGTVTFQGKGGIVKITASYAGDETYCASEGYYTINVSCPGGAPKIVAADGTNMSGCNTSVTLLAKQQDGTSDFADGTYQWFRDGKVISGATSSSYTATQKGVYTVERTNTSDCTTPSTNSAIVTSEVTEPEVERLTPFQYYHVDSVYPAASIMRYRHLFAVKNSGTKNDKIYQMEMSSNRGALTDVTNSNALVMDADTILLDLNKLNGKYSEGDTLKFICHAIDCNGNASNTYKDSIYVYVINKTRSTLALILNGKGSVVGGDFFDYEPQNLQQQTGEKTWSGEWSMYTELKEDYIVTPVSGYAQFNKLNYEPFDIVFLTDFPKASKSPAAATVLDDMAALCDFRPLFSFKTHMVAKSPSKWAAKGFTTSPVSDTKNAGKLNLNIVCYAHPMFDAIKSGEDVYTDIENTSAPLVYKMLSGEGYEGSKGMQGFEIADAENFVTIGLTHHDATITYNAPQSGDVTWVAGATDRMLVTVAERQTNIEARMILFSLNAGAHSKLTDKGEQVVLACLRYLLKTDPMAVADCSFTFDNGASNEHDDAWYADHCSGCTGTKGDHKWTTAANWAPSYNLLPGEFTSVRIEAAAVVDTTHAHVMEIRIKEGGSIEIPVGKALDVKSTIRRLDGSAISPTENSDIYIASEAGGNGTLIFNNNTGDSKATVAMYTTAKADTENMSAATSTWQYIGTPHSDVVNARHNYYNAWLYQQNDSYTGWTVIPNGGPLETFRGYCVTHPQTNHTFIMEGTLAATTSQDIDVPAGQFVVMANSWVAPIDIKLLTDNDFENITEKSVYFFNTGSDPEGTGTVTDESGGISEETRWAAGTYVSVPIHAASYTGKDDHIPSMQGFYVVGGTSNGTLHLDYNRHVRKSTRGYASGRMHAPKRGLAAADGEPEVAKLFFRGNRYDDRLIILEREDFTEGYDSGWDGEAWGGNDAAPMSYVSIQGRQDAVSAVPEYEGTLIGFRAGEDSEYLINFVYSPENEPLYLYDTETNQYSQVVTGNAYHFTTSDKQAHERFILTRKAPQVATGVEPTSDSSLKGRAKKLLIEDKLYILLNGMLYDATGKVVK